MILSIFENHTSLSASAADMILEQVRANPDTVLCLAAGDTPRITYTMLAEKATREHIDFTRCTFIGLDEWIGIPPENSGSCAYFLNQNLFQPLHIRRDQIHLFNALSDVPEDECSKMDQVIKASGGIDLILVGVGMNGHIGFNEPGASPDLTAHLVPLDETTKKVGQKYFNEPTVLEYGITLGLKHLLETPTAIMMASGKKKAPIIKQALEGAVTPEMPASVIRDHTNGIVMLDEEAASELTRF